MKPQCRHHTTPGLPHHDRRHFCKPTRCRHAYAVTTATPFRWYETRPNQTEKFHSRTTIYTDDPTTRYYLADILLSLISWWTRCDMEMQANMKCSFLTQDITSNRMKRTQCFQRKSSGYNTFRQWYSDIEYEGISSFVAGIKKRNGIKCCSQRKI